MKKTLFTVILLSVAFVIFAAKLPTYKAEVGPPIDKQNEGYIGDYCSLHCKIRWVVGATSSKKGYDAMKFDDNRYKTAWAEGKKGYGKGEVIMMYIPYTSIGFEVVDGVSRINWNGITLLSGDCKSKSAWKNSSRVKKMKIYKNGEAVCYITMEDTDRWQNINFPADLWLSPGDQVEAEIISVYNADAAKTALTEFVLLGGHGEIGQKH